MRSRRCGRHIEVHECVRFPKVGKRGHSFARSRLGRCEQPSSSRLRELAPRRLETAIRTWPLHEGGGRFANVGADLAQIGYGWA